MTNLEKIQDLSRQLNRLDCPIKYWDRKFPIGYCNYGEYNVYEVTEENIHVLSGNFDVIKFPLTMFNETFLGELYREYVKICSFKFLQGFIERNLKFYV